jgi:homoserine dehydrogenase
MLTKMAADGSDYDTVLKEAQALGYAEADPTADVEGHDAAAKIAILTTLAFNTEVAIAQVPTEGITHITPLDIRNATEMGYVIKLLAIANRTPEGIDMRVHPMLLPREHALASVNGVFNAIFVVGDSVGETMFYGEGAGAGAAASAVVGDLIEVAQRMTYGNTRPYIRFGTEQLPLKPLDDVVQSYYLRLPVPDRVGVVAQTAAAFAAHGVSIDRMMQSSAEGSPGSASGSAEDSPVEGGFAHTQDTPATVELIYVTHPTREGNLKAVIASIEASGVLAGEAVLLRML